MPASVRLKPQRVIICKLAIDLMREIAAAYIDSDRAAVVADEILICLAVCVGYLERRPLTAAKAAEFVGMPRATAIRKLASLEQRGFVLRAAGGKFTLPSALMNSPTVVECVRSLERAIHKASRDLSKVDT